MKKKLTLGWIPAAIKSLAVGLGSQQAASLLNNKCNKVLSCFHWFSISSNQRRLRSNGPMSMLENQPGREFLYQHHMKSLMEFEIREWDFGNLF